MALFKSMAEHVIQIDEETQRQVISELGEMAIQRDKALQQDSAIVQNFWDTYEQIEAQKHSQKTRYLTITVSVINISQSTLPTFTTSLQIYDSTYPKFENFRTRCVKAYGTNFRFKQDGGQQDPEREVRSLLVV